MQESGAHVQEKTAKKAKRGQRASVEEAEVHNMGEEEKEETEIEQAGAVEEEGGGTNG